MDTTGLRLQQARNKHGDTGAQTHRQPVHLKPKWLNREYCFTPRAHAGYRHSRNVQLQPVRATKKTACTSCATLASSICIGMFCASLSQPRRRVLAWMDPLPYRARITFKSSAQKKKHLRRRPFLSLPEVHGRLRLPHQIPSELRCHLAMGWRERSASPHPARSDTCPDVSAPQNRCKNLLVRRVILLGLLRHSLGRSHSTNSEQAFGAPLCSTCVFVLAHRPNSTSSLQGVDVLICSGRRLREEVHFL